MKRLAVRFLLLVGALAGAPVHAQAPSAAGSSCTALPASSTQPRDMAARAQCMLAGALPGTRSQARALAQQSWQQGDAAGAFAVYLAYAGDPANSTVRDGRPDEQGRQRIAQRTAEEREPLVEAIEALAFAAGKGHVPAGLLLARYFHETPAPRNLARLGAITELLRRAGEEHPALDRYGREVHAVERSAPRTKAPVRAFLEAYRPATQAALQGHAVQTGGKPCTQATLRSVSSGDIQGAEYLPLKGAMVADSYLLRGEWPEFWTFVACGQEVPVKVVFRADGAGGTSFEALHNAGS